MVRAVKRGFCSSLIIEAMRQRTTLYNRLFAKVYDTIMQDFEAKVLRKRRRHLLANIQGTVLEIGAGTGANFPYYPPTAEVLAIEPSAPMLRIAQSKLSDESTAPQIILLHSGIDDAELEKHCPAGGFDAVVCTLVLCTVPDLESAIDHIKKYLKPNGRLYVLEHICSDKPINRFWQHLVNPFWRHLAEGCNLTRHTDTMLKTHGFQPEWEKYETKGGIRLYTAVLNHRNSEIALQAETPLKIHTNFN